MTEGPLQVVILFLSEYECPQVPACNMNFVPSQELSVQDPCRHLNSENRVNYSQEEMTVLRHVPTFLAVRLTFSSQLASQASGKRFQLGR